MSHPNVYRGIAVLAGLGLALVMITTTSRALFTDTTDATAPVGAGTVVLTDDDFASAVFNATNLKPGQTTSGCIAVTYSGSLDATIGLTTVASSANTTANPQNLTPDVNLTLEHFVSEDCSGAGTTLSNPADTMDTYWGGALPPNPDAWTATGGADTTQSYKVTVELDTNAANAAQGEDATISLLWTASNV